LEWGEERSVEGEKKMFVGEWRKKKGGEGMNWIARRILAFIFVFLFLIRF
jgi:hypothetical protein